MPLSSFEVAMQTVGSVLSHYRKDKNGVPKNPKDEMNQLVKEQFPHCEKKEIRPGVYKIKIPLTGSRLEMPTSSIRAFGEEGLALLMRSLEDSELVLINFDDELDQLVEEQLPYSEKVLGSLWEKEGHTRERSTGTLSGIPGAQEEPAAGQENPTEL
ncbi:UNVERIFIED_CONTAM: hypothetical protein K2H54_022082 [Gekko kuhli]